VEILDVVAADVVDFVLRAILYSHAPVDVGFGLRESLFCDSIHLHSELVNPHVFCV